MMQMTSHAFAARDLRVFAHRGGARLAPENTMAAFAAGMAAGSDGLECDVHLSRDGVPVVIHDRTLERTSDGTGPVAAFTAAELARVDAGYRFVAIDGTMPYRGQGVGVPTLDEVLAAYPAAQVIIEMKTGEPALARAVLEVVRRRDAIARVCVGSFHRLGLDLLRREAPALATSASEDEARWTLYRAWCRWPFATTQPYSAYQVPEQAGRLRVITPAFLRQAHRARARVDVWVVDRPEEVARLLRLGVDGVITDRPDVAVRVRDQIVAERRQPAAVDVETTCTR